jgi:hypothetical protein
MSFGPGNFSRAQTMGFSKTFPSKGAINVKKIVLTSAALLLITLPATAMTHRECARMWKEADWNKDGRLNVYEETSYLGMMRMANKTMVADGTFMDRLFQESCKTDIFTTAQVEQPTNVVGVNIVGQ